jgi:hypothetical protein
MTKRNIALTLLALALTGVAASAFIETEADVAKNEIQALIEASYINGAFNALDTRAMRDGFHPSFEIHGVQKDGTLQVLPLDEWIAGIEKRKKSPDFDPAAQKWEHRFSLVEVTGVAAIARIELFKDSKHVFTDYLSLLKLGDGWKITDKVYYRHPES